MSPYIIIDTNKNKVTGLIGDTWTTLEEALKFKLVLHDTFGL